MHYLVGPPFNTASEDIGDANLEIFHDRIVAKDFIVILPLISLLFVFGLEEMFYFWDKIPHVDLKRD